MLKRFTSFESPGFNFGVSTDVSPGVIVDEFEHPGNVTDLNRGVVSVMGVFA